MSDQLVLDGVSYPKIDKIDILLGFPEVPVKLDDKGEIFDTTLVTGSVGSQICVGTASARNTVRPLPAWWWYVTMEEKQ